MGLLVLAEGAEQGVHLCAVHSWGVGWADAAKVQAVLLSTALRGFSTVVMLLANGSASAKPNCMQDFHKPEAAKHYCMYTTRPKRRQ